MTSFKFRNSIKYGQKWYLKVFQLRPPPAPLSGCLTNLWRQGGLFLHISSIFGTRCEKGCPFLTWALFADHLADRKNTATRWVGWSRAEGRWTSPLAMGCWDQHCPFCSTVCTKRFNVTVLLKFHVQTANTRIILWSWLAGVSRVFCCCAVLRGLWMSVTFVGLVHVVQLM